MILSLYFLALALDSEEADGISTEMNELAVLLL